MTLFYTYLWIYLTNTVPYKINHQKSFENKKPGSENIEHTMFLSPVYDQEIIRLQTWFSVNRLSLNISKTNYIIFGNHRITADICVRINKEKINRVNSTTFLGVVTDDKVNWKSHILSVTSKMSKCAIMYVP